jgi:hypothetical protein
MTATHDTPIDVSANRLSTGPAGLDGFRAPLEPNATDAVICSYECTFCRDCVDGCDRTCAATVVASYRLDVRGPQAGRPTAQEALGELGQHKAMYRPG